MKKLYAIWDSNVTAKDKYRVTHMPTKFFETKHAAKLYAKKMKWPAGTYKIMLW